jgi:uncharacterized protein (DUF2252 family)
MRRFAGMRNLDLWYSHIDVEVALGEMAGELSAAARKQAEANIAKARTRDSLQAYEKLTRIVDGQRRIVGDPPLVEPIDVVFQGVERDAIFEQLRTTIRSYRSTLQSDRRLLLEEFRLIDAARKVVGVGSVGTRAWIVLLLGRDDADPLFLQAKEAEASVLEEYVGGSGHANHGERVVHGQHLMQAASDIFLGWDRTTGADGKQRDFYVRQLRDWKGSADVETMTPQTLSRYGGVCAMTLARGHARSGDRIAIAAYLGNRDDFDLAIAEFAEAYADQNERDYQALVEAERSGRITVQRGL